MPVINALGVPTKLRDSSIGGSDQIRVHNRGTGIVEASKDGSFVAGQGYQIAAGAEETFELDEGEQLFAISLLTLAAPAGLGSAPVVGGGTFAAATYFWKITALNAQGETIGSNEATAAIALNGRATLTWTPVAGATGYKIYRSTTTGSENVSPALVATVGAVATYTDTGSAVTAGAVPAANTAVVPAAVDVL